MKRDFHRISGMGIIIDVMSSLDPLSSRKPDISSTLASFSGKIAGSLGMGLDRQGVFESPLLGGDLFASGHEAFYVGLDRLLCHLDRFVYRPPEGDATRKSGDDGAVASLTTSTQSLRIVIPILYFHGHFYPGR
jgi:hypothetical protein